MEQIGSSACSFCLMVKCTYLHLLLSKAPRSSPLSLAAGARLGALTVLKTMSTVDAVAAAAAASVAVANAAAAATLGRNLLTCLPLAKRKRDQMKLPMRKCHFSLQARVRKRERESQLERKKEREKACDKCILSICLNFICF